MATPIDDEELRTIGLPRGAAQEMVKRLGPANPKAPGSRPPLKPRGTEVDASPSHGAVPLPDKATDRATLRDSERDFLATVPPPVRRREEREVRLPASLKAPGDLPARIPLDPIDGKAQEDTPRANARPIARSSRAPGEPVESPKKGRLLNEPDCSTAQLPGSHVHPGGRSHPLPSTEDDPDVGVPIGDDTSFAPAPAVKPASPLADTGAPLRSDTLDRFPDSDHARRPNTPPSRPELAPGLRVRLDPQDGIERTTGWVGPLPVVAGTRSILQFFHNTIGRWSDLGEVGRAGSVLGRYTFQSWDASPEGLAEEHLKIGFEGDDIYVEPLETLNGVYRKLQPNRREELPPKNRFRIGRHVLEFRLADPPAEITPLRSSEGEVFQGRVLVPLGFVDLIGPDGRPYLSFPMTKREERGTRIGRAGVECDIALFGDEWVSLRHARIWFKDGKCWLEDLESTNGTFLIIDGRTPIRRGSARYPDTGDEILVGGYKIRVIEEKA